LRCLLFLGTGLAVPLFAFPLLRVGSRPLDLATVFAAAFAAASVPALLPVRPDATGSRRTALAFAIFAALVPLFALLPPRASSFSMTAFLSSEAHWILVTGFFAAALTLRPDVLWSRRFVTANLAAGCAVALFALYQVVGSPRGWPGAGPLLVSFQREPFRFTPVGATFRGGGYMRPTSLFLEPAWMGGYLAWIVALALLAPSSVGRGSTALRWSAGVLGVAAIAASVSWGAYADLAVVLVTAALWRASRGTRFSSARRLAAGLAAALLVLALALATPPGRRVAAAVGERLTLLKSTAAGETESGADTPQVRLRNAEHAWNLFVANPWKGIGLGQFGRYAWDVGPVKPGTVPGAASFGDSLSRRDPWFGWLTIATEAGVAGPLVLAVAAGIVAFRARGRSAGLVAALAALAVVQQIHTGSYIDLWWWYPLSLAAVLGSEAPEGPPVRTARA